MSGRSNLADLEVVVRRETDLAYGIADPNKAGNIIWLPKSQCQVDDYDVPSGRATLTAPEWLLTDKGLT